MNERIARLRQRSFEAEPAISTERAELITRFYRDNEGKHPVPVLRALSLTDLCEKKTIYIGEDELIVGERGPEPKVVPTFPELTCHTVEDLKTLNAREQTRYATRPDATDIYEKDIIPYWRGRSMRDRVFSHVPQRWRDAYKAGVFTEFMEQRAPGHTALDGEIYRVGMLDYKERIRERLARLDYFSGIGTITDAVRAAIARGALQPGDRLPTIRETAVQTRSYRRTHPGQPSRPPSSPPGRVPCGARPLGH